MREHPRCLLSTQTLFVVGSTGFDRIRQDSTEFEPTRVDFTTLETLIMFAIVRNLPLFMAANVSYKRNK